ncbi:helix-turn-helix domain-containing protein [Propionibacteriaceae bacterium Y2011]|uniref:helix-turn-helix domain-containing protein n=1 Tax=Microlunatus sp. Y2014 TaxID=3418488 RepID=UPI003B4D281E
MAKFAKDLGGVGEFIAERRRAAELSLRQLAEQTGVSNPYLSQIERGMRKPSADVLQKVARALQVSAETLYVRAGMLDPDDDATTSVEQAILADTSIAESHKDVLLEVYASFVALHATAGQDGPDSPAGQGRSGPIGSDENTSNASMNDPDPSTTDDATVAASARGD